MEKTVEKRRNLCASELDGQKKVTGLGRSISELVLSLKLNAGLHRVFTAIKKKYIYIFCRWMQLSSKAMSHLMCKDYNVHIM